MTLDPLLKSPGNGYPLQERAVTPPRCLPTGDLGHAQHIGTRQDPFQGTEEKSSSSPG
jgi:hypothetical protein